MQGVKKGDRVAIYMPMILELVVAMLGCARIGAVHSIVFGGYSAESLAERILDAKSKRSCYCRWWTERGKLVNLKAVAENAIDICIKGQHTLKAVIVVRHLEMTENDINIERGWKHFRMVSFYDEDMVGMPTECTPEWMKGEDPLFILYTSGSTGKPKGIVHTTAGYMLYAHVTFQFIFNYHPERDIYFCTADIGWITGHTYVTYGPLLTAATSVMFEGVPFYPNPSRFWDIIDKEIDFDPPHINSTSRASLRTLGSVGEPIDPDTWEWYFKVVGNSRCPIVDTYWQTETGGIVITPLSGPTPLKPGSATFPFFGVVPNIISEEGVALEGPAEGYLAFDRPWPGMMRNIHGSYERFAEAYFSRFPGYYCTGDGARRDADNYHWVTGRIDDMLNVSGHLLSTAKVESALLIHPDIVEAAVVGAPHPIKGQCIYCFIVLKEGQKYTADTEKALKKEVRYWIGPFATPEYLHVAQGLPKTRSGKIMRRILRKIAANDRNLGDLTSLADASVIEPLFNSNPTLGNN
ncbi:acetyl-coenzyme A synthetase, cytoplasmic [Caerostris extrusa]|uniref:acetate--CoA ligase n=1 Tax=Caerostris extrusa TaxID=172846 RepID=A0AAV4TWH6_CAEEX|nr:acetyl-coenzyme A synthetase, cytoplasmic [Caerostris extrusa]